MGGNIAQAVRHRESGGSRRALQRAASQQYIASQPALWREEDITRKLASTLGNKVDKAFAAAWQDDRHLLVGTKSNHLLQWDTTGGSIKSISLPPAPPRQHPVLDTMWGSAGMHAVVVNPAGDMVACGGSEPADCAVLRLPDFKPVQTLVGHVDWVFGTAWVSDRHIVTGSRDQSVALWTIPEPESGKPDVQYKGTEGQGALQCKFEGKVRDVKYDLSSCRLAALSTDGYVKLLDPSRNLRTVRTLKLALTKELVCMEQRQDLLAVGSVGHVTLMDPRRRSAELHAVVSPDDNQGVRSIQLTDHLLSFGTGRGKLFFYDLRACAFLPTEPAAFDYGADGLLPHCKLTPQPPRSWQPRQHLQLGPGYVLQDELYYDHFAGMDIKHACYAHLWDASRSRLFVCGGPLAFGLSGLYMAIWQ